MPQATRTAKLQGALTAIAIVMATAMASPAVGAPAGSTFLVSRPDGNGSVAAPTDNDSGGPIAVSQEGRYVAFVSAADGFAPGANPGVLNVFVRDTVANTTTLVSRSDGLNGVGANASVDTSPGARIGIAVEPGSQMPDGPHNQPHVLVAFASGATNLVDHTEHAIPPTGGKTEVWLRDVTAGTTYLVSREPGLKGEPANGRSTEPSLAAGPQGALVAFTSASTNLGPVVAGPPPTQVYMRDVTNGVTDLVSCANRSCGSGAVRDSSLEPSIQFVQHSLPEVCGGGPCALVAFTTFEPTIAPSASGFDEQVVMGRAVDLPEDTDSGGFGGGFNEWFTQSARTNEFANESVPGNQSSWAPDVLEDGREVVFLSEASNLDPGTFVNVPGERAEVFYHFNGLEPFTALLSEFDNGHGSRFLADSPIRDVSAASGNPFTGIHFAFDTSAANLGAEPFAPPQVRAYMDFNPNQPMPTLLDRAGGEEGALGDGRDSDVTLSGDGSLVAFATGSDNLDAGGGRDFRRVYVRHLQTGTPGVGPLQLASRPSGTGSFSPGAKDARITPSASSADGRFVAFESNADDLSNADDNDFENVFVRDTVKGTTTLVNRANGANGAGADAPSELIGISENGQRVLFTSAADSLGLGGSHGVYAYVRDIGAQTTTLVSRLNGPTGTPVPVLNRASISGDGNRVAFITRFPLDPEAANGVAHVYVRDLAEQTTTFVDRDNGVRGEPAGAGAEDVALDRKGDRVAWTTMATLFGTGAGPATTRRVYLRDLNAGTTVLVSRADGAGGAEANAESLAPALNAAGNVVAFESEATNLGPVSGRSIWVRHVDTNRTELVSRASGASGAPADAPSFGPSIDAAGDRVAFLSNATDLGAVSGGSETPPGYEAYVRDLGAQTTQLVSRVDGAAGAPARPSPFLGAVSISGSGDCVAFAGTGLNYTDMLSGADFPQVRERVLRGNCGPASASDVQAETPAPEAEEPGAQAAVLRQATVEPSRFAVGGPDGGTEISFVLDRPSRVTVSFHRVAAPTFARRAGRTAGRLVLHAHRGRNRLHFSGVLGGRVLAAGRYRWSLTPLHGSPATGSFVILRHRRR